MRIEKCEQRWVFAVSLPPTIQEFSHIMDVIICKQQFKLSITMFSYMVISLKQTNAQSKVTKWLVDCNVFYFVVVPILGLHIDLDQLEEEAIP